MFSKYLFPDIGRENELRISSRESLQLAAPSAAAKNSIGISRAYLKRSARKGVEGQQEAVFSASFHLSGWN